MSWKMSRLVSAVAVGVALVGCTARSEVKHDSWITDCDTLTQELARIYQGMEKEEVLRILGNESWVLHRSFDSNDRYHTLVVYHYNQDCLKLGGRAPKEARRRVMIEYLDDKVDRIADQPVAPPK